MRKNIELEAPSPEVAHNIVKGLKKISDQTGKHKYIARIAKLSDLPENKLELTASKMTSRERRNIFKAFLDLERVVHTIANTEMMG
jgi:hypothetical protein